MATISFETLTLIIKNNPSKSLIENARKYSAKLQLNVLGKNSDKCLVQNTYFENKDVFEERNRRVTSNKDLFARLLHREEMVFSAKGGASNYTGLSDTETQRLDALLDKIRFNMTIRQWIKEFALKVYRVDPMGVFFIETDSNNKPYPTYKSTDGIFYYQTNGRKLECICFRLTINDAKQFLTDVNYDISTDDNLNGNGDNYSNYYRFVDDVEDRIVKNGTTVELIDSKPLTFDQVPAIIASDLIDFTNNKSFLSPLDETIELADTFIEDRSIRDQSKKYNGFAKSFEPLVTCGTCAGACFIGGNPCPSCTPPGADKGTGFKLSTKVADSIKVPLPREGQTGSGIKMADYFGYSVPPIEIWDKQDTALNDIEAAMNDTYWGTTNRQSTTGPTVGQKHAFEETATKTLSDLQPIYARLNKTADWAETTENALCNLIGYQMFKQTFKGSVRTYGRYYVLETPDELMEQYLDMKTKGAPKTALFDVLSKYYHAVYNNDQVQLAIKLKLMDVEPFIHETIAQVQANNPSRLDFFCKLYFAEWLATQQNAMLLAKNAQQLKIDLSAYAALKMVAVAELLTPPVVTVTEKLTQ